MLLEKMTLLGNKWMTYAQTLAITTILRNIYIGILRLHIGRKLLKNSILSKFFPISTQIKIVHTSLVICIHLIKYPDIIRMVLQSHLFNICSFIQQTYFINEKIYSLSYIIIKYNFYNIFRLIRI